ncbi:MAG: hypothetical protein ACRDDA_06350, partial [Aeromonas sp.]
WVEMKGVTQHGQHYVRKVEALEEDDKDEMDLEGPVEGGRIWGYTTSDNSLQPFEGRWLELECQFDGMRLSHCREDD